MCKNAGIYGFLCTSWVLITAPPPGILFPPGGYVPLCPEIQYSFHISFRGQTGTIFPDRVITCCERVVRHVAALACSFGTHTHTKQKKTPPKRAARSLLLWPMHARLGGQIIQIIQIIQIPTSMILHDLLILIVAHVAWWSPHNLLCYADPVLAHLTTAGEEVDDLDSDLSGLSHDLSDLSHDLSDLSHDLSDVSHDLSDLSHDLSDLSHDLSDLSHDLSDLSHDLSDLSHDLSDLSVRGAQGCV